MQYKCTQTINYFTFSSLRLTSLTSETIFGLRFEDMRDMRSKVAALTASLSAAPSAHYQYLCVSMRAHPAGGLYKMKMAPIHFSYPSGSYLEWTGLGDWARNSTNHIDDSIVHRGVDST